MIRAPAAQCGQRELDQRERREHVDPRHVLERVERVVGQRRLRAGAEDAGVVDEQVDAAAGGRRPARGGGRGR